MRILGVDWGEKKIGLAWSEGKLAEPLVVVKDEAAVVKIAKEQKMEKVVVGVSEGESGRRALAFSKSLAQKLEMPVVTFDETLTTQDAQRMAQEAGMGRGRRRQLEDAFAAAVMLQSYLETEHV